MEQPTALTSMTTTSSALQFLKKITTLILSALPTPPALKNVGWWMALFAVSCFSCKAILVRLMYQNAHLEPIVALSLRMLVALPCFVYASYYTWQPLNRQQKWQVLGAGILGYYGASLLDFLCLQYIHTGLERLILFLNPSIVLILSRIFFKQSIQKKQFLAMLLAYASFAVILLQESFKGKYVFLGITLALMSTISYALYLILCASAVKKMGAIRLTSLASCVATALCIAHLFIQKTYFEQHSVMQVISLLTSLPPQVYYLSIINGLVCTVIPIFLTVMAIERCGPNIVAQTSILGPSITLFLAVWLLNEPFTIYHLIGTTGTVMSMVVLLSIKPQTFGFKNQ